MQTLSVPCKYVANSKPLILKHKHVSIDPDSSVFVCIPMCYMRKFGKYLRAKIMGNLGSVEQRGGTMICNLNFDLLSSKFTEIPSLKHIWGCNIIVNRKRRRHCVIIIEIINYIFNSQLQSKSSVEFIVEHGELLFRNAWGTVKYDLNNETKSFPCAYLIKHYAMKFAYHHHSWPRQN
jgi:hypothetical protein